MKELLVLLANGFEEIEAITVIDLLRRAGVGVTTAGLDSLDVDGAHGITVRADTKLVDITKEFDGIVLPGGQPGSKKLAASEPLLKLIRSTFESGKICAAICAAPSVLAAAGILTGKRVTCFPGVEEQLGDIRFIDAAAVRDENIVTGRSAGTAVPFALELIAMVAGQETSDKIRMQICY